MAQEQTALTGPDLTLGIPLTDLADGGKLVGHAGGEQILLVRRGTEIFAIGAECSHYHGPLVDGIVDGDIVRCPWHHACFNLRTGEASRAPAFDPVARWSVEQRDGKIFAGEKQDHPVTKSRRAIAGKTPDKIVIVGGGAAGYAATDRLRREGFQGSIVMLSNEDAAPIDRPNLSKDYLAGGAPDDWVPMRPDSFYPEHGVDLRLNTNVTGIDARAREVVLANGNKVPYDRLMLATGAEPVHLSMPGVDQPNVHTLRTLADCRAIIEQAKTARRAVVLGASFIGLEVAASLRARGIDVHVVAPDKRPMERVLGPAMGDFVRSLHEEHGVVFHLDKAATAVDGRQIKLSDGGMLAADFVVAGVGVRPRIELAEKAGLTIDRGVVVNAWLETSVPEIFAAGDIARWPDPYGGEMIRVEHWVVAQRHGQTAALNMLGHRETYTDVPFFWSQHYDVQINYVGHAEKWDELTVDGDIAGKDCLLRYRLNGKVRAVASIFRDVESLLAEAAMETRAMA
jgi:NADPH-dependent 2,4-dienoyl-CoA reductase/sulfur reductase-like enzyme/nitrite reductase/ring-hydroxylating ferredoxin subunit